MKNEKYGVYGDKSLRHKCLCDLQSAPIGVGIAHTLYDAGQELRPLRHLAERTSVIFNFPFSIFN